MPKMTKLEWVEKEIAAQRQWMAEHGENLAGYVAHYGSKDDADYFGDGGEAIYAADLAHLNRLVDQHTRLRTTQDRRNAPPDLATVHTLVGALRVCAGFTLRVMQGAVVTRDEASAAGHAIVIALDAAGVHTKGGVVERLYEVKS